MNQRAVRARVTGLVQGVGFRQGCRQMARSNGLDGWVRNAPDGSVEVFAQGSADSVDALITWLWSGPSAARVSGVESDSVAADYTLRDFFIHPDIAKTS
jgi:acylphosphatase